MIFSELDSIQHRIKTLFTKVDGIRDDELKSELAKYLVILCSGFIEVSCRDMVEKYVKKRGSPEIERHINGKMIRFTNPNKEIILQLCGSFSPEIKQNIEENIEDELFEAPGSIIGHRHNLVHGRNSTISLAQIKDYYERSKKLMNKIQNNFFN